MVLPLIEQYGLTPVQHGMLMHSRSNPGGGDYVQQLLVTLSEPLDAECWQDAWMQLVECHEILRTAFNLEKFEFPFQAVHPSVSSALTVHEWRYFPTDENERRLEAFLVEDRRRGFEMDVPPLWRWNLFHFAGNDHRLVWTSHHALFDGRSRRFLMRELFARYDAACGQAPIAFEKPKPFADYVRWRSSQDDDRSKDYWQNLLQGFSRSNALPGRDVEFTLPAGAASHGIVTRRLTLNQTQELQKFADEHGVTLNTLLQAAWALLMGCYSGSDDVVFGATRAGRRSPVVGVESMVGLLLNTLPVRVRMPATASLTRWLHELRSQWIALREFEPTSLTKVQQWSDLPSGQPLFESVVNFENFRLEEALWRHNPVWRTRRVRLLGMTPYPLVVAGYLGQELTLEITYDCRRFDDATMDRMAGHLETVFDGMVRNPRGTLRDLPILTEPERKQILIEWNNTATNYPKDKCIHHLFREQVERSPETVAVVFESQSLTYHQLDQRANQLAHQLIALGVGPGVLVAISVERSLEMIVGLLGILKSGGAYLAVDDNLPSERIRLLLMEAQPRVLLTRKPSKSRMTVLAGEALSPAPAIVAIEEMLESAGTEAGLPQPQLSADHPAYVSYTSGSTGQPKGVVVPQRGVVRLVKNCNYVALNEQETLLHLSPLSFDASTFEIWGALLNGGRVVLMPPGPPSLTDIGAIIRQQRVTTLWLTSGLFHLMVEERLDDLKPLRQLLAGGDVLSPEAVRKIRRALPGCRIINGYGPTENTTFTACYEVLDETQITSTVPIGRPISNTQVYVLDPSLRPLPVGVTGELYAGGDGVACGYLRQPELTAARFLPNPFSDQAGARLYRTGDLARWRPDGNLEFMGRLDHQVKIRGFRIEPGEIEAALRRHAQVADALVAAVNGSNGFGRQLIAYVVPHSPDTICLKELRNFLAGILPEPMIPTGFMLLKELPLSANGKVDWKRLPEFKLSTAAGDRTRTLPRNEVEEILLTIFAELLRRKDVGIEDDFFDLGGHSLLAMQAVFRARQALGVELPVADLFRCRTVARLAARLSAGGGSPSSAQTSGPVPVPRHGSAPLLFSQLAFWDIARQCPNATPMNPSRAYRLKGDLATEAMRQALALLVQRHEALRTTFREVAGQPRQFVLPAGPVALTQVDLSQLGEAGQEAEIQRLFRAESMYRFDLGRDPLLRATLVRLNDCEHVLLLITPHIVMDATSLGIFNRDLAEFYRALVAGQPPVLPALSVQPFDVAVWEHRQMEMGMLQGSIAHWRQHLKNLFPAGRLPEAKPLAREIKVHGFSHRLVLSAELVEALKVIGREENCTFPTTMFAAVNILQYTRKGREDCLVSAQLTMRTRPEIEGLLSCLRKHMLLFTRVADNLSFREILQHANEVILGAYSHLDVSLELIFPEKQTPYFDDWPNVFVNFNYIYEDASVLTLPGLETTPIMRPDELTYLPFTLVMFERNQAIQLMLRGRADLFIQSEVQETLEWFVWLLGRLVAMPDAPLSEVLAQDANQSLNCASIE